MGNMQLIVVTSLCLMLGCSKKEKDKDSSSASGNSKVTINPQILRIGEESFRQSLDSEASQRSARTLLGGDLYTTDVAISSLKYPIASIYLTNDAIPEGQTATAGGNLSFDVYTCAGAKVEDCLVDLNGEALKNLLTTTAVSAKVGSFTRISINMCPKDLAAANTYFLLKASVTIGGTKYYTNATTGLSATGPEEEVKILNGGGCTSQSYLPNPLVIGENDVTVDPALVKAATSTEAGASVAKAPTTEGKLTGNLDLRLYFDLLHAAYATDGSSNPMSQLGTTGCAGTDGQSPSICVNFPKIMSPLDSAAPSIKRIKIDSNTIFGFYFASSDTPFGAYQRVFFNGDLTGVNMDTLLGPDFAKITKNDDGTFKVRTLNDGRYYNFDSFKFETHAGSFDKTGVSTAYTATLLP